MLGREYLRERADEYRIALQNRGARVDLDRFVEVDAERRRIIVQVESLKNQRNVASQEIATLKEVVTGPILATARKGTFGHGMAASGGWELTAQYLGYTRGRLYPTPLPAAELNPAIGELHDRFVFTDACPAPRGPVGKLSSGIGGINACVVSRPWEE